MLNKLAEMKKVIDGVMKVEAVIPGKDCKKHKELADARSNLFKNLNEKKEASAPVPLAVMGKKAELLVEIADGPLAETAGLAGRDNLPNDRGMLFKRADAFWMKGVNFDLDIMFTDKTGEVRDIQTMAKLNDGDYPVIYRPSDKTASIAIEAPAGWCESNNVDVGDRVIVHGGNSDYTK